MLRDHSTLVIGPLSPEVEGLARRVAAERSARIWSRCASSPPAVELASAAPYLRRNFAVALAAAEAISARSTSSACRRGRRGARPPRADAGDRRRPAAGPRRRPQPGRGGGARRGAAGDRRRAPGDRLPGGARRQGRRRAGRRAGPGAGRRGRDRGARGRAGGRRAARRPGARGCRAWPTVARGAGIGSVEQAPDPAAGDAPGRASSPTRRAACSWSPARTTCSATPATSGARAGWRNSCTSRLSQSVWSLTQPSRSLK